MQTTTELTGNQINELRLKYRYVRFIPDGEEIVFQGKKTDNDKWADIEIPQPNGVERMPSLKLYLNQQLDLQEI